MIRIVRREHTVPRAIIAEDGKTITFIYDGDPVDLARMGVDVGQRLGPGRSLEMLDITQP